MKNGWFTIKEVSDLFDNTRGAIRFYEEKGLIHPRRDEHDFRWYSVDDIFQLFYLRRYASMSFSLDETLHTFVKKAQLTLPEIQAQITKREQELDVQIERLMRQREELRKYQRVLRECQFPRTVIEECPDYYVLSADASRKDDGCRSVGAQSADRGNASDQCSCRSDRRTFRLAFSHQSGDHRSQCGRQGFHCIRKCASCKPQKQRFAACAANGTRCRGS